MAVMAKRRATKENEEGALPATRSVVQILRGNVLLHDGYNHELKISKFATSRNCRRDAWANLELLNESSTLIIFIP